MNVLGRIVAVAAIAFALPVHAQSRVEGAAPTPPAAASGPVGLVYLVPGVTDNGGAGNTGMATVFLCTNASTSSESIQIVVRTFDGTVVLNSTSAAGSAATLTASTHGTVAFFEDITLNTGVVNQGQALIFATSQFVFCSAMIVDAASSNPVGISLHMVRFGGLAGTQE